jgi:hypothetical protein
MSGADRREQVDAGCFLLDGDAGANTAEELAKVGGRPVLK